jgi:hypothetical protein
MIYPLIEVEWLDTFTSGGWKHPEQIRSDTMPLIHSVGYLIQDTEERLVLVQQVSDAGYVAEAVFIPKGMVKRVNAIGQLGVLRRD